LGEHRARFSFAREIQLASWTLWVVVGARFDRLGSGGAGDAVFQEGDELCGVAGWRETDLAGTDEGQRFACG